MQQNRSELIARAILDNAVLKAAEFAGVRHPTTALIRAQRLLATLRMAPHLIEWRLNLSASAPSYPSMVPTYNGVELEIAEKVYGS